MKKKIIFLLLIICLLIGLKGQAENEDLATITEISNPTLTGTINTTGTAFKVIVEGDIAFLSSGDAGLHIINVSKPTIPSLLGTCDTPGSVFGTLYLNESFVLVADGVGGLREINISDLSTPTISRHVSTSIPVNEVIRGALFDFTLARGTGGTGGLTFIGDNFTTKGTMPLEENVQGVHLNAEYLYIANHEAGLKIMFGFIILGSYDTPGIAIDVKVNGNYAYIADGLSGLQIIDVSDPASPSLVSTFNTPGFATEVFLKDNYAYIADGSAGLQIIDISNPASPFLISTFNTPGTANGVFIKGDYAYVADGLAGLQIIDVGRRLPIVITNTATGITTTEASLNGMVNANDQSTTVHFKYGTTSSYGDTVFGTPKIVTGTSNTSVIANLSGFLPNTTYHYMIVGENASGTQYGADMTFTTSAAGSAPTVTTNAASGVSINGAILNGMVNANNQETTVTFDYGLTTGYGTTVTANQSPLNGSTNTSVSDTLSGLIAGTTYHYRVVGENASGTQYGADMTFTTSAAGSAPTVTTNAASGVSISGAILNGMVNANNQETTVTFDYGLTTSYGTTVTANQSPLNGSTNTSVSDTLSGLTAGTTYHYRVVGENASGTQYGADMTFTTSAAGSAPTVTTNTASGISTIGATLNGTVNANNQETTVTFDYGLTTSYGTTVTVGIPVTGTTNTGVSHAITGLTPNTTYHYRAVGQNASGTTYGADVTFSTLGSAPTVSTNVSSGITSTAATLNGTVSANNQSTTVIFRYGLTASYGTDVTADQSPVTGMTSTAVSHAITGLTPNTLYHYRVVGTNATGTTFGTDLTFTTLGAAPIVTTNAASGISTTEAALNGTINANNQSTTVSFEYGLTTGYGSTVIVGIPVTGTTNIGVSHAITGLTPNTLYHYRVVGTNASGTTNGADMTFTTGGTVPTATTNAASGVSTTGAALNGTINANSQSTTVSFEYGLDTNYGMTVSASPGTVSGISNTSVSHNLSGLSQNTTYHFRVVGVNGTGTTNGSDQSFTTNGTAPIVTTNAASGISTIGATLNGTVNANNDSTTVTFQYGLTTSYGTTVTVGIPVTGTTNTAVSNAITGLISNTLYHYRVVGTNASGTTNGADMTFTTGGTAPTVTTDAASGVNTTGAALNGTVNANNDSTTVIFQYGLTTSYGTTVSATPPTVTGTTDTSVSYVLSGLTPNTTYHYRVIGTNGTGTVNGSDMIFTTSVTAPIAITNVATGISLSGATLNGTINANNDSTSVTFDYGTTATYGTTVTATPGTVTGTSNTSVTYALTGLNPNTLYHYRVVGQNGSGTTSGSDMTFTTGGGSAEVQTTAVTGIRSNSAIGGGVVTYDGGMNVISRGICWSTTINPNITNPHTVNGSCTGSFSSSITGLAEGTTYYVRAYAENNVGISYGQNVTFTSLGTLPEIVITNPINDEIVSGTVKVTADSTAVADPVEFYIDNTLIGNGTIISFLDMRSNKINTVFNIDNSEYLLIDADKQLKKISFDGNIDNVFDRDIKVDNISMNSIGEVFISLSDNINLVGNIYKFIKIDTIGKTVYGIDKPEIADREDSVIIKEEPTGNYSISSGLDKEARTIAFIKERPVRVIKSIALTPYKLSTATTLSFTRPIKNDEVKSNTAYAIDWNTLNNSDGYHTIKVVAQDEHSRLFFDEIDVLVRNFKVELNAIRKEDRAYTFKVHLGELIFSIENPKNLSVTKYAIFRSTAGGAFESITEIDPLTLIDNTYTFYDKDIDKDISYTYKIIAYDSSGNILSESELKTI